MAETLIHHAGDGSVVGAADVDVSDGEPAEVTIAGQGIAGLLKAANLRQLRSVPTAAAARWVQTSTAVDNHAMLALNPCNMGFQTADTSCALEDQPAVR